MSIRSFVVGICLLAFCVQSAHAGEFDWRTWRGPGMSGVASKSANPPVRWSESENIRWKVAVPGVGSSTPVVVGDRIFLLTAVETSRSPVKRDDEAAQDEQRPRRGFFGGRAAPSTIHTFEVVCMSVKDGSVLWQTQVNETVPHEGTHKDNDYASASPVTDGKHIWASFGSQGVHCLTVEGELIWSRDLGKMNTRAGFGEGASPALASNALIVVRDHEGSSTIAALDRKTGETLWQKGRDEQTSWSTPVVIEAGGKELAIVNATNRVRAYNVADGELVWECGGQTANTIPSPVVGHGLVYCTSGFRGNALVAIDPTKTGDLTDSDAVRWKNNDRTTPYVPSPVLVGNRLYLLKGNAAVLSCYNATTGESIFTEQRLNEMRGVYASPVAAAGRVYLTGRFGTFNVIADADEFKLLATNKLDDAFDASPAIVGNEILLRGAQHLYCISATTN